MPSCILETDHQAGLWQPPTALVLGTLPAVSTVFPAWTCQATGTMAERALIINLIFIHLSMNHPAGDYAINLSW